MRTLPHVYFNHLNFEYVLNTIAWESEEISTLKQIKETSPLQLSIVRAWEGQSIDFLFRSIWKVPRKLIHQLRMNQSIFLNGQTVPMETILSHGDELTIHLINEQNINVIPVQHPLSILFEDDHLIIVNKKAKMATHPNTLSDRDTLSNAVAFYLQQKGDLRKIRQVHRLDQDTTGCILFAKHALAHSVLNRLLTERKINRSYWAIVHGVIRKKSGSLHYPIGRDRHHPTRRRVSKKGQDACTHFRTLDICREKNITLVECTLETGRTHQIRVHFSHIGHPLVGDLLYGGKPLYTRQALHARSLGFLHPFTNEHLEVLAPFIDEPPIFERYFKHSLYFSD